MSDFVDMITSGLASEEEILEHRRDRLKFCDLDWEDKIYPGQKISWLPEKQMSNEDNNNIDDLISDANDELSAAHTDTVPASEELRSESRPHLDTFRAASDSPLSVLSSVRQGKKDMLLAILAAGLDELLKD